MNSETQHITTKKQLVPHLRFVEYEEKWNKHVLGQIATFSKGKNISKADIVEDGQTECIRYGELYTEYEEVITDIKSRTNIPIEVLVFSEENDVIIPASGETQIDIATAACVTKGGVALGGDLNIIKTEKDGIFLSYYLNSEKKFDIARLAQGNSVVHIYNSQLKTLKLNLPTLAEQQKIASFLTAVDTKLQQLNQKKELLQQYKKGVMQQLFPSTSSGQVAQFRFKQDDGSDYPDWEEKKLGEFCTFFSGGTPKSTNKEYYSGNIPFIGSGDIYDSEVDSFISEGALNNSSAKIVKVGDLLYALYGANSGELAISQIEGAINQAILCIRSKENINYIYYLLFYNKDRIVAKFLQGGQGNLSSKIIKNLKYKFPSKEEEQKIANYLSALDSKIETVIQQIETTQLFKKGLLQQMFV